VKNRGDMRLVVGVIWAVSFVVLWGIFSASLPENQFRTQLNHIEESVSKKDWKQSKESMLELKNIYNKNRNLIKVNNATEIFTTFEYTMGQLDAAIQNEESSSLEYIGGLKSSLDFIMKSFAGP